MTPARQTRSRLTTAALVALLAVIFQALAPPGYMIAATAGARPAVVICTGHGPLTLADRQSLPPRKQKAPGVCAFAGHGPAPLAETSPIPISIAWPAAGAGPVTARPAVFFGRGLAAPPPARGPPSALV